MIDNFPLVCTPSGRGLEKATENLFLDLTLTTGLSGKAVAEGCLLVESYQEKAIPEGHPSVTLDLRYSMGIELLIDLSSIHAGTSQSLLISIVPFLPCIDEFCFLFESCTLLIL